MSKKNNPEYFLYRPCLNHIQIRGSCFPNNVAKQKTTINFLRHFYFSKIVFSLVIKSLLDLLFLNAICIFFLYFPWKAYAQTYE